MEINADWKDQAAEQAVELRQSLSAMTFDDDLRTFLIPVEEANGHNELDAEFLEGLKAGRHINDGFLSDI